MEFVQDNIWLVMIAVVSGALFIWPTIAKRFSSTREIGVTEAVQLINRKDALILDIRDAGEFKTSRVPNARNIPAAHLAERLKELEKFKQRTILVLCQTGARLNQACSTLQKAGFTQVFGLAGGLAAWQQAGMPLEKEKQAK